MLIPSHPLHYPQPPPHQANYSAICDLTSSNNIPLLYLVWRHGILTIRPFCCKSFTMRATIDIRTYAAWTIIVVLIASILTFYRLGTLICKYIGNYITYFMRIMMMLCKWSKWGRKKCMQAHDKMYGLYNFDLLINFTDKFRAYT
jgi:hypothetical protein